MKEQDVLDDVAAWRTLLDGGADDLLALAMEADPREARDLAKLRARAELPLVRCALEVAAARRKARGRLADAESLIADVAGVEQATRASVAQHKAQRFAALAPPRILDLCCGIGSDARALAANANSELLAIDLREARVLMARRHAGCAVEKADVHDRSFAGEVLHIDPSRRAAEKGHGQSRRSAALADLRPGLPFLERLLAEARAVALALSPAVDIGELPWLDDAELEFVSDNGTLAESVVWKGEGFGEPGIRRATRLPDGATLSGEAPQYLPIRPADAPPPRFVHAIDPALERSQLLGLLAGRVDTEIEELFAGIGLLAAERAVESPWLTPFEVIEVLPWRPEKVRDRLRALDGGAVEIKTRAGAVDPDAVRKMLTGKGATSHVVFGLRLGKRVVALITRRVVV
jgi:hypothetical protein